MMAPICPRCGHIHRSDDAVAVGRFLEHGPIGYRARHTAHAPLRATRGQAEDDACLARIKRQQA